MTITIDPKFDEQVREKAQAEGLTIEAYVERLLSADQIAEEELESLAIDGVNSGAPIEAGPATGKKSIADLKNGWSATKHVERSTLRRSSESRSRPRRSGVLLRD